MSREKRNYTVEYKEKAVELSYARGSVVEMCRELDIPTSVLSRWRRESDTYGRNSFPGKGNPKLTDGQPEIAELKRKIKGCRTGTQYPKKGIALGIAGPSLKRYTIPFLSAPSSPRATGKI